MSISHFISLAAALLLLCPTLGGCARSLVGSPIELMPINHIEPGKTTRSDVLNLFGSPFRIDSQGEQEIFTYLYAEDMIIWYVFYTERRQRADVLTVFIGPDRVVPDYSFSKDGAIPDFYRPSPQLR